MERDIHDSLARLAEGDIEALGEIYDALSVRVFNYARTITKNREMSEDITHDVFMRILGVASRLAAMKNPVAYIMVTARNLAYNQLKRSRRVTAATDEAVSAPFSMLPEALSLLPANQRETVYLRHVCGYTQKEVAKIMGVPLVTVKWRDKKAKQQLREYYKSEVRVHETV